MPVEASGVASLVTVLSSHSAFALIGAGSSARAGYPDWWKLVSALGAEALRLNPGAAEKLQALARIDDAAFVAQEHRALLGPSSYEAFIERTFGPEETVVTDFHKTLVRLPFKHVLTTNYDAVLESAHRKVFPYAPERVMWGSPRDATAFLEGLSSRDDKRKYVYLHGRFSEPASVVLTEEDYQRLYVQTRGAEERYFAIMATHPIVTIGFSGADLDVMSRFRFARALGPGQRRHLAVLALKEGVDPELERRRLEARYGIQPVFYPHTPDHEALDALLREVAEALDAEQHARRSAGVEGALLRRLQTDLHAAEASFDHEEFEDAAKLYDGVIGEVRAFGDEGERPADVRAVVAQAKLGLAGSQLSMLQEDRAREVLRSLDASLLERSQKARAARLFVRVGEDDRAAALLEQAGEDAEYAPVRQLIQLRHGDIPADLIALDWLFIEAALAAFQKKDCARQAEFAMSAGAVTHRNVVKCSALQLLTAALLNSVRGLDEFVPVPLEARRDIVVKIEQLAEEVQAAGLPPPLMKGVHSALLNYAVETQNRVALERAMTALQALDPTAVVEDATFKRAIEIASAGDAIAAAKSLGSDAPEWWRRLQRVALYYAAGETENGVQEAVALARDYPGYAAVELEAAQALLRQGDAAGAEAHARRAYELIPGIGQQLALAQCLVGVGKHAEAATLMEAIPGRRTPEAIRAKALANEPDDRRVAAELWVEYLSYRRADARARVHLATLLYALGRNREAAEQAWVACSEPGSEALPPEALYQSALLQRVGLDSGTEARERARKIAAILSTRRETDPEADRAFMQLYLDLDSPEDLPEPDLGRLASAGLVRQVSLDEVKEHLRESSQRQEVLWRLWDANAITLSLYAQRSSVPVPALVAFAVKANVPLPAPSFITEVAPVDVATEKILTGNLELLLLDEVGLLEELKRRLQRGGVLLMFSDVADAIATDVLELGHREHPEALRRYRSLWDKVTRGGRVRVERQIDPRPLDRDWAAERGLTLIDSAEPSSPSSTAAFVRWLVTGGFIERSLAERYWRRVGVAASESTIPGGSVAVGSTALVELDEAGILDPVLQRAQVEIVVPPRSAAVLQARLTDLEIARNAFERAQSIQRFLGEGVREGWVQVIDRPTVKECPPLKNPDAAPLLREGLEDALAWRVALLEDPQRLLFSCDALVTGLFTGTASPELMSQFQWTREGYLSLAERMRSAAPRMISLSTMLRSLERDDVVERRRLAETGHVSVLRPQDLVVLAREFGSLASPNATTLLDRVERSARRGVPGSRMAAIEIAQLYCGAIWDALTEDEWRDIDSGRFAHSLLDRLATIDDSSPGKPLQFGIRWLALRAASKPAHAFVRNGEGKLEFSDQSRSAQAWRTLFLWAENRGARYVAALWRGVNEALLEIDAIAEGRNVRVAPLLLACVVGPRTRPAASLADELAPLAILSGCWAERPLHWMRFAATATDDGLDPESTLAAAAVLLEQAPSRLISDGESWHFTARTQGGVDVEIAMAPEAVLLRSSGAACSSGARQAALEQGVDDGIAYDLLRTLASDPASADVRTKVARRATGSPWRTMRRDPSYVSLWGILEAGPLAVGDRDELEGLLSESRDVQRGPIADVLSARMDSGEWADRGDKTSLIREALFAAWPLSVQTSLMRLRSRDRAKYVEAAREHLWECRGTYWAEVAADLLLVLLDAETPPGPASDVPAPVAVLIESVLEETVHPPPGTYATVEAGMVLECALATARICGAWLSVKDFLWLSHRLARWLYVQMLRAPEASIGEAFRTFDAAGRRELAPPVGPGDVLDPRWFGPGGRDVRLLSVLAALEIALQPASTARWLGREASLPAPRLTARTKAMLAELASRELTEAEKQVRATPDGSGLLSWGGKSTVPDLALSVLLLDDGSGWLLLNKGVRERWISQLPPLLTEERASAPQDLLRRVLHACVTQMSALEESEVHALERRVSTEGWPAEWMTSRILAVVGLLDSGRDVRDVTIRLIADAVGQPDVRLVFPLVLKIWAEKGWSDADRFVGAILAAAEQRQLDSVELLLAFEPVFKVEDAKVLSLARGVLKPVLDQERFGSEARLGALRQRVEVE